VRGLDTTASDSSTSCDVGVDVKGETRQVSWIDFDNDGRKDSTFLNARAAARPLSSTARRRK